MKRAFLSLSLICVAVNVLFAHPIKMTTGRLFYNEETQQCELLINFFIDDFSAHLTSTYFTPVTLDYITEDEQQQIITDYIQQKVAIYDGGAKKSLTTVSCKIIEENVLQVRFICYNFNWNSTNDIKVLNSLLLEAFDNQSNILHIELSSNGRKHIARFTHNSPIYIFNLQE